MKTGDLFERTFTTPKGNIGLLAEVVVEGKVLHLKDVVVFEESGKTVTYTFAEALRAGRSRDDLIRDMKEHGLTILEAIKTARELFGVSLGEAKLLVSSHPDWRQTAEAGAALHEEIIQALKDTDAEKG